MGVFGAAGCRQQSGGDERAIGRQTRLVSKHASILYFDIARVDRSVPAPIITVSNNIIVEAAGAQNHGTNLPEFLEELEVLSGAPGGSFYLEEHAKAVVVRGFAANDTAKENLLNLVRQAAPGKELVDRVDVRSL